MICIMMFDDFGIYDIGNKQNTDIVILFTIFGVMVFIDIFFKIK